MMLYYKLQISVSVEFYRDRYYIVYKDLLMSYVHDCSPVR